MDADQVRLDDLDRAILKMLQQDGRMAYMKMAKQLK